MLVGCITVALRLAYLLVSFEQPVGIGLRSRDGGLGRGRSSAGFPGCSDGRCCRLDAVGGLGLRSLVRRRRRSQSDGLILLRGSRIRYRLMHTLRVRSTPLRSRAANRSAQLRSLCWSYCCRTTADLSDREALSGIRGRHPRCRTTRRFRPSPRSERTRLCTWLCPCPFTFRAHGSSARSRRRRKRDR